MRTSDWFRSIYQTITYHLVIKRSGYVQDMQKALVSAGVRECEYARRTWKEPKLSSRIAELEAELAKVKGEQQAFFDQCRVQVDRAKSAESDRDDALRRLGEAVEGLERLKCRFGCDSPVVGIYSVPEGCICWRDPVQALCAQHIITAESTGPITPLIERPEYTPSATLVEREEKGRASDGEGRT